MGIGRRVLQALLPLTVLLDAVRGVSHVDVGRFYEVPDAAQLPLHVLKLVLDGLQPLALLASIAGHFCSRGPRDGFYSCAPLFTGAWFCLTTPVTSNLY